MSKYVIMRGGWHPIAIVIPSPVAVRDTRKEANAFINSKRNKDDYYIRCVKDDQP